MTFNLTTFIINIKFYADILKYYSLSLQKISMGYQKYHTSYINQCHSLHTQFCLQFTHILGNLPTSISSMSIILVLKFQLKKKVRKTEIRFVHKTVLINYAFYKLKLTTFFRYQRIIWNRKYRKTQQKNIFFIIVVCDHDSSQITIATMSRFVLIVNTSFYQTKRKSNKYELPNPSGNLS